MIHFFEGFSWPQPTAGITDNNSFCEFNLGNIALLSKTSNQGRVDVSVNASYRQSLPAKRTVPLGDRLVVGYNAIMTCGGTVSSAYQYANIGFTPIYGPGSTPNPTYDTSFTSGANVTHSLPVLHIGVGNSGYPGLSLRNSINGASIWYELLPGVNFKNTMHYYEVVYDALNNKIEVWLDNLLVGTVTYTFTATQKAAVFRISLDVNNYWGNSGSLVYPGCLGMYVADERLGPVKFGYRPPLADADVSPNFKTAPYFSKVNQRSDGLGNKITTTLSKQRALFSSPTPIVGDVLALSIGGRFSSLEQSALESLGGAKLVLRANGQIHETAEFAIPKQSFVKHTEYLEKSPFTGSTWTADEVNNMLFGAEIVVEPKNVS